MGRSIGLFGDTGAGKTTLAGEYAKWLRRTTGLNSMLHSADPGGYKSLEALVDVGIIVVNQFSEEDDPWAWLTDAVAGKVHGEAQDGIGLHIFDSGTGIGELLLKSCAELSIDQDIGGRPAPKFTIHKKDPKKRMDIGSNVDSHYMIVQNFVLGRIHRSTWLTAKGTDTLWTFSVLRAEDVEGSSIVGPKLVGKALTPSLPKYFNYMFRVASVPEMGQPARHILNLDEQPEVTGLGSTPSNARYPLDAITPLPATIEPASLSQAIELIEGGRAEARDRIKEELGL
jgi:hypothetical protein